MDMPVIPRLRWIKSIGAEFEGGGPSSLRNALRGFDPRVEFGGDGSVNVKCDEWFPESYCARVYWVWNYEIRFWSESPYDLELFADLLWSNGFRQNETCGNHMHFRFNSSLALYYLSDWDFVQFYLTRYIQRFGRRKKYMARLSNGYSKEFENERDFEANVIGGGSRYRVINFNSLYENQRTLEIRVMPWALDADEWKEMMWFNVSTIEEYLDMKIRRIEESIEIETPESTSEVEEGVV